MRASAVGLALLLVAGCVTLAQAQVPGLSPSRTSTAGICADYDPLLYPGVVCNCDNLDQIKTLSGCADVSQVVCINDFQYNAPLLMVSSGETVAWVNLEFCGDIPPEDLIVNTLGVGCDPHHEVVTDPAISGATGDAISERAICSPNDGVIGSQVMTLPTACATGESNVRCHTFDTSGIQHYTCHTNDGHAALMHGLLLAQ